MSKTTFKKGPNLNEKLDFQSHLASFRAEHTSKGDLSVFKKTTKRFSNNSKIINFESFQKISRKLLFNHKSCQNWAYRLTKSRSVFVIHNLWNHKYTFKCAFKVQKQRLNKLYLPRTKTILKKSRKRLFDPESRPNAGVNLAKKSRFFYLFSI